MYFFSMGYQHFINALSMLDAVGMCGYPYIRALQKIKLILQETGENE